MTEHGRSRGRQRGGQGSEGLTTADLVVVSLLLERPMHGYDLLSEYRRQEVADWASISKAQLYYALNKLVGLGMLEGLAEAGSGARERIVYRPTALAIAALERNLCDARWAHTRIAQPFTTWLGLSIHTSAQAQAKILSERVEFLSREIAKETASLAYIMTLKDDRAERGAEIVELILRQLTLERDWATALLKKRTERQEGHPTDG